VSAQQCIVLSLFVIARSAVTWQSSLFLSSALCHLIRFYNAATDEEKLTAAASLSEILRQIDEE